MKGGDAEGDTPGVYQVTSVGMGSRIERNLVSMAFPA